MVGVQPPAVVGRDRELELLRDALDSAIQGQAALVLLGGEAGIGKTTLAGSLAVEACARNVAIFTGYCDEFDMVPPYGPWLNAGLLHVGRELPDAVAVELTPERKNVLECLRHCGPARPAEIARELDISPNAAAQMLRRMFADGLLERPRYGHYAARPPAGNSSQTGHSSRHDLGDEGVSALSAALIDRLRGLCLDNTVLLVLEDMHWSDEASLVLVSSVMQQLAQERLLVVMTYRDDETLAYRPLRQYLPALLRRAQTTSLQLGRLEPPAIQGLVTLRYGLPVQDAERASGYLHRYAEGNPFFTEELLRSLEFGDVLRHTVFGWALAELPQFHVPPVLRQLIAAQLELLDADDRRLLQIAAVIGLEISYELWLAIAEVPDEELTDGLERAMQTSLIVETADRSGLRFRHALIRETLYDTVILPRRRAWHRRIGDRLAEKPDADPESIAHHFKQAGDSRAADWLIRAGRRAARASAYVTATALLEQAQTILTRDHERTEIRAWLLCEMAEYYRFFDHEKAFTHLETARVIAAQTGDGGLRVLEMACRGRVLGTRDARGLDEFRRALDSLDELSASDRERVLQSPVGYLLRGGTFGQWLVHYGRIAEGLPLLEQAVASDGPRRSPGEIYDYAMTHFGLGIAYSALGDPEHAQRAFAAARAHLRSLGVAYLVGVTIEWELCEICVDYHADQPAERQALVRELAESFQGTDFVTPYATEADLLDGRWDEARASATELQHIDALRIHHALLLADLDRLQGNYAQAWSHIAFVIPDGPDVQPATDQFHNIINLLRTAAELALDQRELEYAERWIGTYESWLQWSGMVLGRAALNLLWSRYHQVCGDLDAARERALAAYDLASTPRQALALLASMRALGEIDTLGNAHDDARRHLDAALDLADACAAPYERATTLLALARLDLAMRRVDAARVALDEAEAICSRLGARPALTEIAACRDELPTIQPHAGLSTREFEVLSLVSEGLTDREVADRLYVSPRTVNQHLRSIYNKLGVNSRTAATRQALERGII